MESLTPRPELENRPKWPLRSFRGQGPSPLAACRPEAPPRPRGKLAGAVGALKSKADPASAVQTCARPLRWPRGVLPGVAASGNGSSTLLSISCPPGEPRPVSLQNPRPTPRPRP